MTFPPTPTAAIPNCCTVWIISTERTPSRRVAPGGGWRKNAFTVFLGLAHPQTLCVFLYSKTSGTCTTLVSLILFSVIPVPLLSEKQLLYLTYISPPEKRDFLTGSCLSYKEGLLMKKKLKACPICGRDIAKNANICPHCGGNLTFRKPGVWVGLILWIAALFCMMKACGAF